ncbi:hypothetical protein E1H12_10530 [Geitlerinema sp. P-1104]|uniref:hypothetical protein n=1 Tax=Geitlerinema sp. P-1104 TaxID=2546230 RepID=UPI001476B72F|nr:hypothetical protein [Geitlerinema sp. P-1104]NMG58941.1 hypothetical protein [Geitlerinema sp. P-1104]
MPKDAPQTSNQPTRALAVSLPLSLLKSGQILALTEDSKGGLILQKGFYCDWIPPGSLVGGCYDIDCTRIHVSGKVRFYAPNSQQERSQALQKRMGSIADIQDILNEPSSFRRAFLILRHLSQWLSYREMRGIPHELLAQLVGVNPSTVRVFWKRYLLAAQKRAQTESAKARPQVLT